MTDPITLIRSPGAGREENEPSPAESKTNPRKLAELPVVGRVNQLTWHWPVITPRPGRNAGISLR